MTSVTYDRLGVGVIATIGVTAIAVLVVPSLGTDWPFVMAAGLVLVALRSGILAVRTATGRTVPPGARRRPAAGSSGQHHHRAPATSTAGPVVAPSHDTGLLTTRVLTLSKHGADECENEDASAIARDGHLVAVADGASSAYASGEWSRLLVERFVGAGPAPLSDGHEGFVEACAQAWQDVTALEPDADWWAVEAQRRGSYATFAGVTISESGEWEASVVGDCCVLATDAGGELLSAFPLERPEQFTSTPSMLQTNDPAAGLWCRTVGHMVPGDALFVASDGLAEWLLAEPGDRLSWIRDAGATQIEARLDQERASGAMVNDDVTLVVVRHGRGESDG
ncbi:MAG: protein phosphatase 2C domain-containing protein [Acidimicrobiia bacterium]|nr:protein phosphatase 2C domain-containing protein [Acidimicrobiia bacterium]